MFLPSRTKTAFAAAAGLGGLGAAAVTGGQPAKAPPEPDAKAGPVAGFAADSSDYGQIARATESAKRRSARATGRQIAARARARRARAKRRAQRRSGFTIVHLKAGTRVSLRAKPGGRTLRRVNARTEFGSPQTLTVAKRRGRWLGVTSSTLPNGRIAWVNGRSSKLQKRRTRVSLHVDVSRRILELRDGRHHRTVRVALGAKLSPTPAGRYAITDKLSGARYGGVYGCCILALSGRQTHLPPGWTGGDRLAIHGVPGRSGAFAGSSAGCVRADRRTLQVLMREVPLGTPVFVRH